MKIFRHYNDLPDEFRGGAIAIGNFDGVHLGHRQVIRTAGDMARSLKAPWGVLTFEPHPRMYFQRNAPPFRLTPFHLKAQIIAEMGVDFLMVLHFDEQLSRQTADDFVDEVLADGLGARHVVCGFDFVFGHKRGGNSAFLREKGDAMGFATTSVGVILDDDGSVISSTRVREMLTAGNPRGAAKLLGRPHEIAGRVAHGDQRGRTIGFPTANIELDQDNRPTTGVYAIRACIEDEDDPVWYDGVANLGRRPTVTDDTRVVLETHLFDFSGDIYGKHLRVALIDYLRPEKKFDGLEALTAAIREDSETARRLLQTEG